MAKTPETVLAVIKKELELTRPTFEQMNLNKLAFAKEMEYAIQILENNDYLAKMNMPSIRNALINVALSGITLNPVLKKDNEGKYQFKNTAFKGNGGSCIDWHCGAGRSRDLAFGGTSGSAGADIVCAHGVSPFPDHRHFESSAFCGHVRGGAVTVAVESMEKLSGDFGGGFSHGPWVSGQTGG